MKATSLSEIKWIALTDNIPVIVNLNLNPDFAAQARQKLQVEAWSFRASRWSYCSRTSEKDRNALFPGVFRPVLVGVVHCLHLDSSQGPTSSPESEPSGSSRPRSLPSALSYSARSTLPPYSQRCRRSAYRKIRLSTTKFVGQIADDQLLLRLFLNFLAKVFADICFLSVPERILLAEFPKSVAAPLRAFR